MQFIVDAKLRPLGVLETESGDAPAPDVDGAQPLLALRFRQAVIPPSVVNAVARIFKPLFFPLIVGAVLAWVGVLDVWLFFHHGVAGAVRDLVYHPTLLIMLLGLLAVSALFHECGHATACRYGGATPGAMGAGLYIVWPAFYTDVTDAYRLNRVGRLRTDFGGVYFNLIFILAAAGVYFWTGFEPLLALIALQHIEILHQFVPWIRLDGYYVVSDITGVPDVMSRIKPTLLSLIPGREPHPRVAHLKRWVRGVVTLYVLTVVPVLIVFTGLMIIAAPHVLATAASSAKLEAAQLTAAFDRRAIVDALVAAVQLIALLLPPLGLILSLVRLARVTTRHVGRRMESRPRLRNAVVFAGGAAAALFGFNWWTNHPFDAIARGDRGTIQSAAAAIVRHRPRRPVPPGVPKRAPTASTPDGTRTQTLPGASVQTDTSGPRSTSSPTHTTRSPTSSTWTAPTQTVPAEPPPVTTDTVPTTTTTPPQTTTTTNGGNP